ncbi:hypothetical protein HA466_0065430 [Hirschfeldia incana]|nr:hypothetical protein HA466_0065430 [Hirschfeldia incana]
MKMKIPNKKSSSYQQGRWKRVVMTPSKLYFSKSDPYNMDSSNPKTQFHKHGYKWQILTIKEYSPRIQRLKVIFDNY